MSHDFRPLIAAALMTLPLAGTLSLPAHSEIVARDIHIIIDKTNDENKGFMGQDHEARAFYDDAQVDPATHRVKILHEQHTPMLIPKHPDPNIMPVGNAWLDLGSTPIRYHFAASPGVECLPGGKTMWKPYAILFDENSHRMTIRNQETGEVELSGLYTVEDKVLRGPEIQAVITDTPAPSPYPPSCP
jgi:hypothetical protein